MGALLQWKRGGEVDGRNKVGENESLDNALKRFKGNVPVLVFFPNIGKENIMKSQA